MTETMTAAPPLPPPPATAVAVAAPPPMKWRIVWRGYSFSEDDVTGEHLSVVALLNGRDSWSDLDLSGGEVSPLLGPVRLMSMLTAFLIVESGSRDATTVAAVAGMVGASTADELLTALRFE